jgi:hypothetical protein
MTRTIALLTAGLLSAAVSPAATAELEVRLQNDVGVAPKLLKEARATAEKVYRRAGVSVTWLDCTKSKERLDDGCEAKLGPTSRILRLVPRRLAQGLNPRPGELGRALLREDDRAGTLAYIFEHRVEDLSQAVGGESPRLLYSRLLGYAMAHELAHLMGVAHGQTGVMDPSWNRDDLSEIRVGSLALSRAEAESVVEALGQRTAAGD